VQNTVTPTNYAVGGPKTGDFNRHYVSRRKFPHKSDVKMGMVVPGNWCWSKKYILLCKEYKEI